MNGVAAAALGKETVGSDGDSSARHPEIAPTTLRDDLAFVGVFHPDAFPAGADVADPSIVNASRLSAEVQQDLLDGLECVPEAFLPGDPAGVIRRVDIEGFGLADEF